MDILDQKYAHLSQTKYFKQFLVIWLNAEVSKFVVILQYFCFGAVVPDGYGFGYLTLGNDIPINITSYRDCKETDSKLMAQHITDALIHGKNIHAS